MALAIRKLMTQCLIKTISPSGLLLCEVEYQAIRLLSSFHRMYFSQGVYGVRVNHIDHTAHPFGEILYSYPCVNTSSQSVVRTIDRNNA